MATSHKIFLGNLPQNKIKQMKFYRSEAVKFGKEPYTLNPIEGCSRYPQPTELLEYWLEVTQSSVKKSVNSASIKLAIISLRLPEDGATTPRLVVG